MVLVTGYLWVQLSSPLLRGVVAVVGLVTAVSVLFYAVNEQSLAWVRYASRQGRRRNRQNRTQPSSQRRSGASEGSRESRQSGRNPPPDRSDDQ